MIDRTLAFSWGTLFSVLSLVAGCASPPPPAADPEPEAEPPPPAVAPQLPPPPSPLPKPVAAPNAGDRERALGLARDAFRLLFVGNEERARPLLEQALQLDASNTLAGCLQRGMSVDPIEALGRASTPYAVQAGETMTSIAQRVFGDACGFYLLARYNQFRASSALRPGQILRIPGTAPLRPRPVLGTSEPTRPSEPDVPLAPVPAERPAPNEQPAVALPAPDPSMLRAQAEEQYRLGVIAFAKQDPRRAIQHWRRTLELNSDHPQAARRIVEAQKALDSQNRK